MPDRSTTILAATVEFIRFLRLVAWLAAAVAMVYFGVTVPIRETAGQETVLTVVYRAAIDMDIHVIVPYVTTAWFSLLWWNERRTRITAVERENRRNRELEKKIDPDRTSSEFIEIGRNKTNKGGS